MKRLMWLGLLIVILSGCGASDDELACLRDADWATRDTCHRCHTTRFVEE